MRKNIKWTKSMLFVIFSQVLLIGMLSGCAYFPMEKEQQEIEALKPDKTDEIVPLPFAPILSIETASEDYIREKMGDVSIIVNDKQEQMDLCYHIDDAYLLCQVSGETYLVFDDENLDYHGCVTYLFDITDGMIEKKEECGAWIIDQNVNSRSLMLGEIVEVFGTYFTAAQYTLRDESLIMVRSEVRDIYRAIMNGIALDVINDLPVVIEGETSTLPPGTQIIITAIGDDNIVYFTEVGTGVKGEIRYTTEDGDGTGNVYVDGAEEASYFEFLPYSG